MRGITLRINKKAWLVKEPSFFQLRRIISIYKALQAANPADYEGLIKQLFKILLGWRWPLAYYRLNNAAMMQFLTDLPEQLGLEPDSKAVQQTDAWGDVYAHLSCTFAGWTYDYIDQHMTLSRLKELRNYLQAHPPTHLLVAAYLQYEPPLTLEQRRKRFFDRFTKGH